jgi:hypothetical protein
MTTTTHESVSPAFDVKEFTSFAGDIDLTSATHSYMKRPARAITIVAVGAAPTLVLQMVDPNGAPLNRTLTALTAGEKLEPIQVRKIIASGTADITKVRVYW